MNYNDFITSFKNWQKKNNFPNRAEARIVFKNTKSKLENNTQIDEGLNWVKFLTSQSSPSSYIDSLYKRDNNNETKKNNNKENIINACYNYIKENNCLPTFNTLRKITNIKVSDYYNYEDNLYKDVKNIYNDVENYLLTEDIISSKPYQKIVNETLKQYNKFIITTAVSGKLLNKRFYNSIKSFIKENNAACIVMPSADIANRKEYANKWIFPPELREEGFYFIYEDTYLNSNLYLSDINISAKQINPISGLGQYTQDASVIIASPKQVLEFIPTIYEENKIPRAIMTTGAITENDYSTDFFMTKRISKIAEYDHIFGAVIVEIEDNNLFHFRQVQADESGSFIDLGIKYSPNKEPSKVENSILIVGDCHFGEHDKQAKELVFNMIKELNVKDVVLHDVFTGLSINHHEQKNSIVRAIRANNNELSLQNEIYEVSKNLLDYSLHTPGKVIIVHSNHHDFIDRYLSEGLFIKDPINAVYSCDIFKYLALGNKTPLKFMVRKSLNNLNNNEFRNKFLWLENDSSYVKYGYELALHGHKGANGSRGNKLAYRKAFKGSISGHTHTPNIYKNAITVGTTSKLQLIYNVGGLSSWVQNCCILYPNGTYQLLNMINVPYNENLNDVKEYQYNKKYKKY